MDTNNGNEYPYRLCQIRDRNGDLAKRWYVEFYVWDLRKGNLVRATPIYISSFQFPTAKERYAQANYIKKVIDKALVEGKVLGKDDVGKPQKTKKNKVAKFDRGSSINEVLDYARKAKQVGNSERTIQVYDTIYNRLIEFFEENSIETLESVSSTTMFEFMDWLVTEYELGNTTRNNYLENVKSLFNVLVERKLLKKNPCRKLRKLKEAKKKHTAYTDSEAKAVKDYLIANDPQAFLFCSFIYYGYIRPKELRFLQVGCIEDGKILIPAFIMHNGSKIWVSKNRKNEYVVIPNGLKKLIDEYNILSYPSDYFVFSTAHRPDKAHVSANFFNKRYREYLKELELTINHTAYSWKHTGVIKLYNEIKDVKKVQQQCRHQKLETTVEYLRDLGLFDNKEVEMMFPEF